MTISEYAQSYQGKRVVNFEFGSELPPGDVAYRLVQEYDSTESQIELLEDLLKRVDPGSIEVLIIGPWAEASNNSPQEIINALIARRDELVKLRSLFVGEMTYEDCEISWIVQTSYNELLEAFPKLESLRIRGAGGLALQPFVHTALQELAIECGGLPSKLVDAIAGSTLPALRRLELWLGDEYYGFNGDVGNYQRLLSALDPRRLEYLGLRNSCICDELAVWLAGEEWLGALHTLDLSKGTIGDVGARAFCESPHLGNLKRLDLSHHYISAQWQEKLLALPCTVVLDDPVEEEDEGERYVAVAE